jgi:hypothetical protein
MPPRPGVRTHQQSIHRATNIAAEVRDEIRGTKIADSGVRLDELVSPDAPQITLMIESQCSRAALGLLISGRTGDPRRLEAGDPAVAESPRRREDGPGPEMAGASRKLFQRASNYKKAHR